MLDEITLYKQALYFGNYISLGKTNKWTLPILVTKAYSSANKVAQQIYLEGTQVSASTVKDTDALGLRSSIQEKQTNSANEYHETTPVTF
jgi:hypothetical protein